MLARLPDAPKGTRGISLGVSGSFTGVLDSITNEDYGNLQYQTDVSTATTASQTKPWLTAASITANFA